MCKSFCVVYAAKLKNKDRSKSRKMIDEEANEVINENKVDRERPFCCLLVTRKFCCNDRQVGGYM